MLNRYFLKTEKWMDKNNCSTHSLEIIKEVFDDLISMLPRYYKVSNFYRDEENGLTCYENTPKIEITDLCTRVYVTYFDNSGGAEIYFKQKPRFE